ncbi:MAG: sporulation initiation factor Spo0A C-terminal domain-containing protein [Oscillospiraceae bacterium]|nr:sporulation initiation factor Spo0A C-terminal domain-containing protein [Oscillospiraceae bacterium]
MKKKFKIITLYENEEELNDCLKKLTEKGYIHEIKDISEKRLKEISNSENMDNERKLKRHIIDILDSIGMPNTRRGYDYVISGVILLHKKGKIHHMEMKKIYMAVSNVYGKSPHSVEKAIREAIERTCSHGHIDELHKLFSNSISKKTGTINNKKFLYELAKKVI